MDDRPNMRHPAAPGHCVDDRPNVCHPTAPEHRVDDRLSVCLFALLDEALLAAQPPVLPRSISNVVASAYCRKLPLHRKVVTWTQTHCLAWRPTATRSGTYGVDPSLGRGLATSRSNSHV